MTNWLPVGETKISLVYSSLLAKPNRKLTFLYLANDVIQNSKRKGPEFTKDFAPVIVEAFKHVSRYSKLLCSVLPHTVFEEYLEKS